MTEDILTFQDIAEINPHASKRSVENINKTIRERLVRLGIVSKCEKHIPKFVKLAKISGTEWEDRQWGYKCIDCGTRLHPTNFIEYDPNVHSFVHREPLKLGQPKTALEASKDLIT